MNAEKIRLCKDAVTARILRVSPTCDSLFPFSSLVALALLWLFFSVTVSHIIVFLLFVPGIRMSALFYIPSIGNMLFFPWFLISSISRIHSSMSLVKFLLKSGSHTARCLKPDFHSVYCPSLISSSVSLNAY